MISCMSSQVSPEWMLSDGLIVKLGYSYFGCKCEEVDGASMGSSFVACYFGIASQLNTTKPEAFIFRDAAFISHNEQILNVVPGDFTHDGTLDLLVMSQGTGSQLEMELYVGAPGNGFSKSYLMAASCHQS